MFQVVNTLENVKLGLSSGVKNSKLNSLKQNYKSELDELLEIQS